MGLLYFSSMVGWKYLIFFLRQLLIGPLRGRPCCSQICKYIIASAIESVLGALLWDRSQVGLAIGHLSFSLSSPFRQEQFLCQKFWSWFSAWDTIYWGWIILSFPLSMWGAFWLMSPQLSPYLSVSQFVCLVLSRGSLHLLPTVTAYHHSFSWPSDLHACPSSHTSSCSAFTFQYFYILMTKFYFI